MIYWGYDTINRVQILFDYAPAEIGHRSAAICHHGNIAMLLKRKLRWNPDRERFDNDDQANRLLSKPYRAPWHL